LPSALLRKNRLASIVPACVAFRVLDLRQQGGDLLAEIPKVGTMKRVSHDLDLARSAT
jgi:hypothetical protein